LAMKRIVLACTLAGLGLFGGAPLAQAQGFAPQRPPNPFQRPTVSPYVNLGRGVNPAATYYGLIKPQMEANQQIQQLQIQQNQLMQMGTPQEEQGAMGALGGYSITGHNSQFGNISHYFPQPGGAVRPIIMPVAGFRRQ